MESQVRLASYACVAVLLAGCQGDRAGGEAAVQSASSATALAQATSLPSWITDDDYPHSALPAGIQGMTRLQLEFGPDGRLVACTKLASSGSSLLDATACRILMRRARVRPDQPRSHVYEHEWRLPPLRG
jgi:TonB family protein